MPVPASGVKLETAYKYTSACIVQAEQVTSGKTIVLAGLTESKDCNTSFTHYAVYLGDDKKKPLKYLGEETAREGRWDFSNVHISDFGRDFCIVEQKGHGGDSRTKYEFPAEPSDKKAIARHEYFPLGIKSLLYRDGGVFFQDQYDGATHGRIGLKSGKIDSVSLLKTESGCALKDAIATAKDKNGYEVGVESGKYVFSGEKWEFIPGAPKDTPEILPAEIRLNENSALDLSAFSTATFSNEFSAPKPKEQQNSSPTISGIDENKITVVSGGEYKDYRLPPVDSEAFDKYLGPSDCGKMNAIGPYAVYVDSAVFGISVYSGEGNCGLGGLGFFDAKTGKYSFRYFKETAPYSTTALLIKGDTVYAGLSSEAEYSSGGEGLAKINLRDGGVSLYRIPEMVNTILEAEGTVFAGTSDGVFAIYPSGLTSWLRLDFEPATNDCLYTIGEPKKL